MGYVIFLWIMTNVLFVILRIRESEKKMKYLFIDEVNGHDIIIEGKKKEDIITEGFSIAKEEYWDMAHIRIEKIED